MQAVPRLVCIISAALFQHGLQGSKLIAHSADTSLDTGKAFHQPNTLDAMHQT